MERGCAVFLSFGFVLKVVLIVFKTCRLLYCIPIPSTDALRSSCPSQPSEWLCFNESRTFLHVLHS